MRAYATNRSICAIAIKQREQWMDETLPDLGDLEREVMQLVWAKGP